MQEKQWWNSRTLWLAIAQGLAGVFTVLATQYATIGWIVVGKSILDAILRIITIAPLGGLGRVGRMLGQSGK